MFFFVVALYAEYRMVEEDSVFKCAIEPQQYESFTVSAKALKGQDPSQAGFAKPNLSVRPSYTFQLNVTFKKQ